MSLVIKHVQAPAKTPTPREAIAVGAVKPIREPATKVAHPTATATPDNVPLVSLAAVRLIPQSFIERFSIGVEFRISIEMASESGLCKVGGAIVLSAPDTERHLEKGNFQHLFDLEFPCRFDGKKIHPV